MYEWSKKHGAGYARNFQKITLETGKVCRPEFKKGNLYFKLESKRNENKLDKKISQKYLDKYSIVLVFYDRLEAMMKDAYGDLVKKSAPIPKLKIKRKIIPVEPGQDVSKYKHKNVKLSYVCKECGALEISTWFLVDHFADGLCRKCRKLEQKKEKEVRALSP